jgi:transcriptional regulator with XRE-family HTH domain
MSVLGERIRQRRKGLHLSQESVAELIGSSQKQISKYENGEDKPSSDVVQRLSQSLNVSADYLLGLTDIPERPMRGSGDLAEDERSLIEAYRRASPAQREQAMEVTRVLLR